VRFQLSPDGAASQRQFAIASTVDSVPRAYAPPPPQARPLPCAGAGIRLPACGMRDLPVVAAADGTQAARVDIATRRGGMRGGRPERPLEPQQSSASGSLLEVAPTAEAAGVPVRDPLLDFAAVSRDALYG